MTNSSYISSELFVFLMFC